MAKKAPDRHKPLRSKPINIFRRAMKLLIRIVTIIFALVGFVSSIFALFPRISVYPAAIFDKNNPMKSVFTISNDGFFPIYDLNYEIATLHLDAGGVQMHGNGNVKIINSKAHIPRLKAFEKASIYSIFPIKGEGVLFKSAEIQIVIHFNPFIPNFKQSRKFRFITYIDDSGKWQWFYKAVEEPY